MSKALQTLFFLFKESRLNKNKRRMYEEKCRAGKGSKFTHMREASLLNV